MPGDEFALKIGKELGCFAISAISRDPKCEWPRRSNNVKASTSENTTKSELYVHIERLAHTLHISFLVPYSISELWVWLRVWVRIRFPSY